MKYCIEAEMSTGTKHKSIPTDVDGVLLKVFYNLGDASYVRLPLSETDSVILSPKHIVSLTFTEIPK